MLLECTGSSIWGCQLNNSFLELWNLFSCSFTYCQQTIIIIIKNYTLLFLVELNYLCSDYSVVILHFGTTPHIHITLKKTQINTNLYHFLERLASEPMANSFVSKLPFHLEQDGRKQIRVLAKQKRFKIPGFQQTYFWLNTIITSFTIIVILLLLLLCSIKTFRCKILMACIGRAA